MLAFGPRSSAKRIVKPAIIEPLLRRGRRRISLRRFLWFDAGLWRHRHAVFVNEAFGRLAIIGFGIRFELPFG